MLSVAGRSRRRPATRAFGQRTLAGFFCADRMDISAENPYHPHMSDTDRWQIEIDPGIWLDVPAVVAAIHAEVGDAVRLVRSDWR